jgi:hypothetical protein
MFLHVMAKDQMETVMTLLPDLLMNMRIAETTNEFLLDLIALFKSIIQVDSGCVELGKHSFLFSETLERDSLEIRKNLLAILRKLVETVPSSYELASSFVSKLNILLIHDAFHVSVLSILTRILPCHQTFFTFANLGRNPLVDYLLNGSPQIVTQCLKILFVLLSNPLTGGQIPLEKIQPLLMSRAVSVSRLAAMCLTIGSGYSLIINDTLLNFFSRAFGSEKQLTLDAIRLAGSISKTDKGRRALKANLPVICQFLGSDDARIRRATLMLLASISAADQLSQSLVDVVPQVMELIQNEGSLEQFALIFVGNMTVNAEAAIAAAPYVDVLVDVLISGNDHALPALYRIITLHKCFQACVVHLEKIVHCVVAYLDSDISSVIVEVLNVICSHEEGRFVNKRDDVRDFVAQQLAILEFSDPSRVALVRLMSRISVL